MMFSLAGTVSLPPRTCRSLNRRTRGHLLVGLGAVATKNVRVGVITDASSLKHAANIYVSCKLARKALDEEAKAVENVPEKVAA